MKKCTSVAVVAAAVLTACGGSGGSDGSVIGGSSDINVALSANGAVATASYDNGEIDSVNDGITNTSVGWAGNVTDDYVQIDFGQLRNISDILIYTTPLSNSGKLIEVSVDKLSWQTTAQEVGGDVACNLYSLSSGRIRCELAVRIDVQYIRFKVTAASSVGTYVAHEIEVRGR